MAIAIWTEPRDSGQFMLWATTTNIYRYLMIIAWTELSIEYYKSDVSDWESLFIFMMTSKLGCDDFICTIVYSLMS